MADPAIFLASNSVLGTLVSPWEQLVYSVTENNNSHLSNTVYFLFFFFKFWVWISSPRMHIWNYSSLEQWGRTDKKECCKERRWSGAELQHFVEEKTSGVRTEDKHVMLTVNVTNYQNTNTLCVSRWRPDSPDVDCRQNSDTFSVCIPLFYAICMLHA